MMKKSMLIAAVVCGLGLVVAQGALAVTITPSIQAASSELNGFNRQAVHTVDSSGFTGTTHTNSASNVAWTTQGNAFAGGSPDYSPSITFNLGGLYDVSALQVWNYNEINFGELSARNVEVFAGATLGTMTSRGIEVFNQGTESPVDPGQTLPVSYSGVQYVRFDIKTNWDGAIYDGTGAVGGADGRSLTGLSEVRFQGTVQVPAPEPSTFALLGIVLASSSALRRRQRV